MNAQTSQCIPCPSVPTIHGIKSATQSAWYKKWPVKKATFSIIFVEKIVIFFSDFWSFFVDVALLRGGSFCNVSLFYWCVWFFYVAPKTYLRVFQGCPRKFKCARTVSDWPIKPRRRSSRHELFVGFAVLSSKCSILNLSSKQSRVRRGMCMPRGNWYRNTRFLEFCVKRKMYWISFKYSTILESH